ncbi:MAG: hypothetical protein J5503_06160 [Muribaculaceae bacterium]|nr:hypothetical protein [Muribaculaceae bacterium]
MNIKLHTPTTLKSGSGMSSIKQFLLSLIATTISIVLTFGTAAIIDHHKKNEAKKEMALMVINDIDQSIEMLEKADSGLVECQTMQQDLAFHPEHFDSLRLLFPTKFVWIGEEFSEITEKIFSTNIETFNTIGNVNFVNEVSSFYLARRKYKEMVLDELKADLEREPLSQSLKALMNVSFPDYVYENRAFLKDMKDYRERCVQLMKVSEEDIANFSKRQKIETAAPEREALDLMMLQECDSCRTVIERAKEKLKN